MNCGYQCLLPTYSTLPAQHKHHEQTILTFPIHRPAVYSQAYLEGADTKESRACAPSPTLIRHHVTVPLT